jgi:predicted ATPase
VEQVFVSRENELERLGSFLARAVTGQGQVCFVTGEAGFGKTSLTVEFARRALQRHNACSLQSRVRCADINDPYLPFLLGMLAASSTSACPST